MLSLIEKKLKEKGINGNTEIITKELELDGFSKKYGRFITLTEISRVYSKKIPLLKMGKGVLLLPSSEVIKVNDLTFFIINLTPLKKNGLSQTFFIFNKELF